MNVYVVTIANGTGWMVRGAFQSQDDAEYLADDLAGPDRALTVRVTAWKPDGGELVVYRIDPVPSLFAD